MTLIAGMLDRYKDLGDSALLAQVQQGDMMAFEALVERHRDRAVGVALKLVGDPDEAADISQEAFIRVYRAVKRFDTQKEFFSWFYVILSNLARNRLKKRKVRRVYAQEQQADTEAIHFRQTRNAPDLLIETDETKRQVWRAIEQLPYNFREIIVLRHFEDLSYEEIARLLNIPLGSVMSRLYYARLKLKQILGSADG
jgi:RNA polymerase sigma-70 factor (ECF subfamily)